MEIEVLSLQQAIRKRPAMYIGPLEEAQYRMLWEFMCIARENAFCRDDVKMKVTLLSGMRCRIEFTGALSVKKTLREKTTAELIMTELFACKDKKPEHKKEFCMSGIAVANALCSDLDLVILTKEKERYFQFYSKGTAISKMMPSQLSLEAEPDTTIFKFRVDQEIIPAKEYDFDQVVSWVKENIERMDVHIFDAKTGQNFYSNNGENK